MQERIIIVCMENANAKIQKIQIFPGSQYHFFQEKMEIFGLAGISRELIVSKTGLVGFKRILAYTKITNPKRLSILQHLQIKVENLESAAEKVPKDLDYIRKMKNVVKWFENYLYHLACGLCPAKVSCLPAKSPSS